MTKKQFAMSSVSSFDIQCECCGNEIKKGEKHYIEITSDNPPWRLCKQCVSEGNFVLTIGENSVKLTNKKDIQSARNLIRLKAYFSFLLRLSKSPIDFVTFDRIVREVINYKAVGLTDEEFTLSISKFGKKLNCRN